jgi:hypothetical protein
VSISQRFEAIRIELGDHRRCHDNTHMLERHVHELEREVAELEAWKRRYEPTHITIHTHTEGTSMSFAPGAPITFTATSQNAESVDVPDTYEWTTTAGTIVPGPDSTTVTISDAPLGDLTVTATDPLGISGQTTVTVADQTPFAVTVTAS